VEICHVSKNGYDVDRGQQRASINKATTCGIADVCPLLIGITPDFIAFSQTIELA